jgi:fimbrial chaperone protein
MTSHLSCRLFYLLFRVPLLCGTLCLTLARADGIVISPTLVTLAPDQHTQIVTLQNNSPQPRYYQVQLFAWQQQAGENLYAQQDSLLVTPPISEVPAGEQQLIRIIRPSRSAPTREQSYRMIISEIPDDSSGTGVLAVDMLLRLSLPVFAQGTTPAQATLNARLTPHQAGQQVSLHNLGGRHARLTHGEWLFNDDSARPWQAGLIGYVLPGQTMQWPAGELPEQPRALRLHVNGTTQTLTLGETP